MFETIQQARIASVADHKRKAGQHGKELVEVHKALVNQLKERVMNICLEAIKNDPGASQSILIDPHEGVDLCGNSLEFVMRGIAKPKGYSRTPHNRMGLFRTPIEEVVDQLSPFFGHGLKIVDITDMNRGRQLCLEINYPLPGRWSCESFYHDCSKH